MQVVWTIIILTFIAFAVFVWSEDVKEQAAHKKRKDEAEKARAIEAANNPGQAPTT